MNATPGANERGLESDRQKQRRMSWQLPPVWVRRCVLAPLIVLLALVWMPTALWLGILVAGVVAWALPGRVRVLRVIFMAGLYLMWDALALVWMFFLWVISGFGWKVNSDWFQRRHYRLAGVMLRSLFRAARRVLRLTVEFRDADLDALAPGRPIIVVSRHAGPADSFIIVEALINRFRREPAIVLKDTLQWDPAVDVLLNRVPARFVAPSSRRKRGAASGTKSVGSLAAGLSGNDALLIFPEGANATPKRREKRIAQLRAGGHEALAERAESMPHVMPPHPGGVLAAIDACPEATVVMIAHTGLERLSTVRDVWRELPVDKKITLRGWAAEPDEIPSSRAEREDWLFDWWERIDSWIDLNNPDDASADAVAQAQGDANVIYSHSGRPTHSGHGDEQHPDIEEGR
ncbi:1-acyl-sn-glycerol-3-phosphate acyltransferase [Demequina sediminicola]|uniref:1-acyl-sn-glycerol-3-phosphate acyltransferase n=1 Tax=Demequina sediminicola TaxID=1095026 RepID=UPI000A8BD97B|nr:1-acyl-sn-glycerol-3-phosphate acyltransferase [Demequina sediminicola]